MKKILLFSHAMEIGGAERALLGLLETIDTTEYEVDLFLMRHEGELMKYIPKKIHLLPKKPEYAALAVPIAQVIKKRQFGIAFGRYIGKRKAAKRVEELGLRGENDIALEYSHKYTLSYMPMVSDETYDLAVSFLTPHYFVADKVNAKKKVAWIHTDYAVVQVDHDSQVEMWNQYNVIASISEQVTQSFVNTFPELRGKVRLMPNIMPIQYMQVQADEFAVEQEMPNDGTIKLLSIGRFCNAKNFDNVPDICKILRKQGLNIKWYLIGYGGDEALIWQKIQEAAMQDYVIVLGKKENPYPYIKACDIYVQPSRYEGKCVSVIEAQILHKPVVITDYPTAGSQLIDGYDGVVVPMDNEGCAEGLAAVIRDEALQQKLVENTKTKDYTNAEMVEELYRLMGD